MEFAIGFIIGGVFGFIAMAIFAGSNRPKN